MRVRVKELAEQRGVRNLSQFQVKAGITMGTARRYWYGTSNGRKEGEPLRIVDLATLEKIAEALGVDPKELIERLALTVAGSGQHTTVRA